MDFVPSSQPLEDKYLLSTNFFAGSPSPANPPSPCPPEEDFDIIASSQPFEDGEEDLKACTPVAIDTETLIALSSPSLPPRVRLIRRAPPVDITTLRAANHPIAAKRNLVRRVPENIERIKAIKAAEMEKKRLHARAKEKEINRRLCVLATTAAHLRRRRRELRACISNRTNCIENKENHY
ncbi:hypothetical protein GGX14DRAFT_545836 [Mycena pura]|uniref:Uncharacterized protein n=1 Tax=Mycena pura TaxID=153505 RepID=A0AAD6UZA7_9AGAR|nr:hypothetical protein GGX14DRAFT_545836 [Mycena pura]